MNPGKLNKRIEIWHYTEYENELYEVAKQEQIYCKLWASITDIRGLKTNKDVVEDVQYSYKVLIRYNKNLDETMIVKYQGRTFKINTIVDVNFAHREMVLLCEEVK